MEQIIAKLSISETDLMNYYLINNVSLAIKWSLKHNDIIKNKEAYENLKLLLNEVENLSLSFSKDIDLDNQLKAYDIGLMAFEIISNIHEEEV